MKVDLSLILGLSIGAEYVHADEEAGIEFPCFILDLLVFRVIVEFTEQ